MKKFTSLVLAFAIGATSTAVFASGGRTIEVFDTVKRLVVNQSEVAFDKANAPFMYNGTTYVPLRLVSEALGESVEWDGSTGTIYIGETGTKGAHYWGTDLTYMASDASRTGNWQYSSPSDLGNTYNDNLGNTYSNFLRLNASSGGYSQVEFPLNAQYSEFRATIGLTDKDKSVTGGRKITIFVDDREMYSNTFQQGDFPEEVWIPLNGKQKITFRYETISSSGTSYIGIFNGEFIK